MKDAKGRQFLKSALQRGQEGLVWAMASLHLEGGFLITGRLVRKFCEDDRTDSPMRRRRRRGITRTAILALYRCCQRLYRGVEVLV